MSKVKINAKEIINNEFKGQSFACRKNEDFFKKRHRLNFYLATLPNHKKPIVMEFLCVFKKHNENYILQEEKNEKKRGHKMTDHAFCRYIERVLNLDVNKMKDRALDDLSCKKGFDLIKRNGHLITVLRTD